MTLALKVGDLMLEEAGKAPEIESRRGGDGDDECLAADLGAPAGADGGTRHDDVAMLLHTVGAKPAGEEAGQIACGPPRTIVQGEPYAIALDFEGFVHRVSASTLSTSWQPASACTPFSPIC